MKPKTIMIVYDEMRNKQDRHDIYFLNKTDSDYSMIKSNHTLSQKFVNEHTMFLGSALISKQFLEDWLF